MSGEEADKGADYRAVVVTERFKDFRGNRYSMHMDIGVLVRADDADGARDTAEGVFDNLCGDGKPFDYFTLVDDMGPDQKEKGVGRGIYRAASSRGKTWISGLHEATKGEFMDGIARVRKVLAANSDEDIWRHGEDIKRCDMFRFRCGRLGDYAGPSIWLYDGDGAGIRDDARLHGILTEVGDPPLWIVLADVHH